MLALVVYDSTYVSSAEIARAVAAGIDAPCVPVVDGPPELGGVGLLVVGGPTQRHGVGPELAAWLDGLPPHHLDGVLAASFDTRVHGPRLVTGSAARGIAHRLERLGATLLASPESFLVRGTDGPLDPGETHRARGWAEALVVEAEARTTA